MRASSTRRRWPPERVSQRLLEHALGQAEVGGDAGGLGLRGPAALGAELGVEAGVALHRLGLRVAGGGGHGVLGLADAAQDGVDAAGGEHPVAGQDVQVAGARVLRQVADLPRPDDLAGVLDDGGGLLLPGEQLRQRGLAGAVAAHETDPHPGVDPEGRLVQELTGADAYGDVVGGDHRQTSRHVTEKGSAPWRAVPVYGGPLRPFLPYSPRSVRVPVPPPRAGGRRCTAGGCPSLGPRAGARRSHRAPAPPSAPAPQ